MARSKYIGVARVDYNETKPYRAFCDRKHVGYFETDEEAAKARDLKVLAMEFLQGREASDLNFSREEYSEEQIGAVVEKLTTPQAPTPHSNDIGSTGSRCEARIRVGNARVLLACCKTKEAAARARDLAMMLLQGALPEAAHGLTLDWARVSPEQLRRQQAPVRAKLVRKLLDTEDAAAAKVAAKLIDDEELQQQQERQQQQQQQRQQQEAAQLRQRSASQTASQAQERRRQPQRSRRGQPEADDVQRLADAAEQAASSLMEVARCAKRVAGARQADAPAAARRRL